MRRDAAKRHGLGALILLVALYPIGARPVAPATLDVEVEGVASGEGNVLIAVCTKDTFLTNTCPYTASAPARRGTVDVRIEGVLPGTYAVQAFHDANANLDLDRNFFGFPKEGAGFSNDAPMRFGPPRFADAAIRVDADPAKARVLMRYFKAP